MEIEFQIRADFDPALLDDALRDALDECGRTAAEYARLQAPVQTGALRDSIYWQTLQDDTAVVIGSDCPYAACVELGSQKRSAHPYLLPAVADHSAVYLDILRRHLARP